MGAVWDTVNKVLEAQEILDTIDTLYHF